MGDIIKNTDEAKDSKNTKKKEFMKEMVKNIGEELDKYYSEHSTLRLKK